MSLCKIITLPEPVLRRKAQKVVDFGADLQKLIDDMFETMQVAAGIGLAATQIGVLQRVITVAYDTSNSEEQRQKLIVIVNPEITSISNVSKVDIEGCLSVSGLVGNVNRATTVIMKGLNRHGNPIKIKADGMLARIFQHEIDHLNGTLFIDRTEEVWKNNAPYANYS